MFNSELRNIDKNIVKACRLYYESSLSKTEIAGILKISITHVNRLLKEASKRSIVNITINAPRFEDLEIDLINKFNLFNAKVISSSDDEEFSRIDLGKAAADYFDLTVRDNSHVGIGSGRTMYEMVKSVKEKPKNIYIYPLSAITERDPEIKSISAFTLVNTLWFKLRPSSKAYKLDLFYPQKSFKEMEPDVRAFKNEAAIKNLLSHLLNLDFYFFSVSPIKEESQIMTILKEFDKTSLDLKNMGIIGDVLFYTISKSGSHVYCGVEDFVLGLETEQIKQIVTNNKKQVIMIAGGDSKFEIINTALNSELCNVLITDDRIARRLLGEEK